MSILVNGKLVRNNKWTGIKTVVKGLRAEQSFFDKVELVAKAENISKNELIVRVVSEYCDKPKFTEVLTDLHCLTCGGKIAERFYDDGEKVFLCHNCLKKESENGNT